ncbi:MAG: N-acetylmuramic acid 6-phosphate etherase [Chloroflexi bacterium]|nr:N-acetylmuramic acid 6-phosphate etherase [Chloroflexota bacterium]
MDIDTKSTLEILELINAEDAMVIGAVRAELPNIARAVDVVVERLSHGGRLIYVGAGTSGRLGVLDAAECPPTYNTPPDLVWGIIAGGVPALYSSIEGLEDVPALGEAAVMEAGVSSRDAVVGLAASGRTPFVLGAVKKARELGAATIGIACNRPSPLVELVDIAIVPRVGPEVVAGSTRMKAGTAQKLVLNMISTATMIRLGKVYSNLMVDLKPTNTKLRARARRMIQIVAGVSAEDAARALKEADNEVKVALVMLLGHTDAHQARERLRQARGVVRRAISGGNVKR